MYNYSWCFRSDSGEFDNSVRRSKTRNTSNDDNHTLIRKRRKSSRRDFDDFRNEEWDEDEAAMLPSLRFQQRSRTKSLKQRHHDLQTEHGQNFNNRPPTLQERFAEMKDNDEVTAGNLAGLMR